MITLPNTPAVIFDLNGTIINDGAYHRQAFMEFFARHGLTVSEEDYKAKAESRKNAQIMPAIFGRDMSEEEIDQLAQEKEGIYRELYAPHIAVVPGFWELAQSLRSAGKKIGLATSAGTENVTFTFEALKLDGVFDAVVTGKDVVVSKPNPEIFLKTAEKLGVAAPDCMVFEDSPVGIAAAKAAGMSVIGLLTSYSPEELAQADALIHNFLEVQV